MEVATQFYRKENETDFEYKVRLCKAKISKELKVDWNTIVDLLDLDESADSLRHKAYAYVEYDNFLVNGQGVATRILSISDLHIPYNLPIETFKDYVGLVDVLVLNGDIEDCQSCSKFSKKYRIHFTKEMVMTRQYIIDLITTLKPKQVIIVKGNHEVRMGRYLSDALNDDIMNIMPDSPMDLIINRGFWDKDRLHRTETWYGPIVELFAEMNIDVSYTGEWYRKVGNTIFVHPLSYSSGMLKTTEKAVEYFLRKDRTFDTIVMSHTHRLGSYVQGDIYLYEQGCCCQTELLDYNDGYMTLPAQKGFIYVCQDINGNLIPNKTKLIDL